MIKLRFYYNCSFNKKIKIPQNITHLIFGYFYEQKVKISQNITHLSLFGRFNHKIKISQNITHLILGYYLKKIINIPQNVTHLIITNDCGCQITIQQHKIYDISQMNYIYGQSLKIQLNVICIKLNNKINEKNNTQNTLTIINFLHTTKKIS